MNMRKERGCERESNRERVRDFQCNVVYASLRCSSSMSSQDGFLSSALVGSIGCECGQPLSQLGDALARSHTLVATARIHAVTQHSTRLARADGNATVHVDAVAGDVESAVVQGEVLDEASDLLGLAEAARRDVLGHALNNLHDAKEAEA